MKRCNLKIVKNGGKKIKVFNSKLMLHGTKERASECTLVPARVETLHSF